MRPAVLLISLLVALSCAKTKPHSEPAEGGLEPSISLDGTADVAALFPHPDGWEQASSHGTYVNRFGMTGCLRCHQKSSAKEESVPTCRSCHPLYPHPERWAEPGEHGKTALEKGQKSCATECHGFDFKGGLSNVACQSCHAIFPHPADWKQAGLHGVAVREHGKATCQGCHGVDLRGGVSGISCTQCHPLYPHGENWAAKDQHGSFVVKNGSAACGSECHGTAFEGGLSGVACESCHGVYPHPTNWERDHGPAARQEGLAACQTCHGWNYRTMQGGKNCYSCHPDYPHPASYRWLPYTGGHGAAVQERDNGKYDACDGCHGPRLDRLLGGKNCMSCHPSFPHQLQANEWEDFEGHGRYTLLSNLNECRTCHGNDLRGGYRNNPSCYSCHPPYPHPTGWRQEEGQPQKHGLYVQLEGTRNCATSHCHGVDLIPEAGVSQGISCSACHETYPHAAGWESGTQHGPLARVNIARCKGCHGDRLDIVPPGFRTCADCHPAYVQHASVTGTGVWPTFNGHGSYLLDSSAVEPLAECQICHGMDFNGGISNRSCRSSGCHASYPHDSTNWGDAAGHPQYIETVQGGALAPCRLCHGADYQGGNAGVPCGQCHATYPHPSSWLARTAHGAAFTANWTSISAEASCWDCHGDPVPFTESLDDRLDLILETPSPTAKSCYECHLAHVAFPHASWEGLAWEPVNTNTCGQRNANNMTAHFDFVTLSSLMTDSSGNHPATYDDPLWTAAIEHTCGNALGGCHTNGNRAYRTGQTLMPCAYCHNNPARPYPPELPDCNPPSAATQLAGPPTVIGTVPANGAVNVIGEANPATGHHLRVTFSEPMQRSTISSPPVAISLKRRDTVPPTPVAGQVSCNLNYCQQAYFDAESPLVLGIEYEARVTTGTTDWGGTPLASDYAWTFTTDGTPPTVTAATPLPGATNVSTSLALLSVQFSEPVNISGVTFTLQKVAGTTLTTVTGGTVTYSSSNRTLRRTLTSPLLLGTTYRATISTSVRDLAGNQMAAPYVWEFITAN